MGTNQAHRALVMIRRGLGAALFAALLAPCGTRADSVVLGWTAPGDDGNSGRAAGYELRYSVTQVPSDTTSWWSAATSAGTLPQPLTAGSREAFTVAGLDTATTYYFIIRTKDEVPNWAGFSNVAVKRTGQSGPTLVTPSGFAGQVVTGGVRLSWNMVTTGSATGYHLYRRTGASSIGTLMLTAPIAQTSWTDTTVVGGTTYEYSLASYSGSNESAPTLVSIAVPGDVLTTTSEKMIGYPNPARGRVTFRFRAGTADGAPGHVRLVVYDLTGKRVCKLVDDVLPAGMTAIDWRCTSEFGTAVSPGLYNAILDAPQGRQVTQLAIVP